MALSTGSVAAADISLDGGVGERHYRPASMADLHDRYELGMGELDIDLRDLELPPGDTPLEIDLGIGDVQLDGAHRRVRGQPTPTSAWARRTCSGARTTAWT